MAATPAGPVKIKLRSPVKSRHKMKMPLNVAKSQMITNHGVPRNATIWIATMLVGISTRWISITVHAGLTAKVEQIGKLQFYLKCPKNAHPNFPQREIYIHFYLPFVLKY